MFHSVSYEGFDVTVPVHAEKELELTYGSGWMHKDELYSKSKRPKGPLKEIDSITHKNRVRMDELNARLSEIYEQEAQ